jgi:hypothetical protein
LSGGSGSGATVSATFGPTAERAAITSLHYAYDGNIYATVKDKFDGQNVANSVGRAFRLTPLTGNLVEWNLGQPGEGTGNPMVFTPYMPYCCCYFSGRLYVGTFPAAINEQAQLRDTDGTFAGTPRAFAGTGNPYAFHSCLAIYNGRLFLGTGVWETTPSYPMIWSRAPGPSTGTEWTGILTASGGAASNGTYFVSMVVFNGSLYASYFNPGAGPAAIYKITANAPGDPTSTSFTITSNTSLNNYPYYLFVDQTAMYAVGSADPAPSKAYTTTDGTTWTDQTTNAVPTFATSSRMRPIFFAQDQ